MTSEILKMNEGALMDIVFLALGIVFFAATVALVHAFERLRKP